MIGDKFEILFNNEWYNKGDILDPIFSGNDKYILKVTSKPKHKWYHRLLSFITFGWFNAKWTYTVKIIGYEL